MYRALLQILPADSKASGKRKHVPPLHVPTCTNRLLVAGIASCFDRRFLTPLGKLFPPGAHLLPGVFGNNSPGWCLRLLPGVKGVPPCLPVVPFLALELHLLPSPSAPLQASHVPFFQSHDCLFLATALTLHLRKVKSVIPPPACFSILVFGKSLGRLFRGLTRT